ncbi:MAG: hypothetical protein LBQ11_01150 [Candidatus Nomurabacteria bacterium]|jgi:pimeloyl-ACP methyl ester carboxylesterase|nr:hypothetical protein [Candidatus Nomurabacteria bacterium]
MATEQLATKEAQRGITRREFTGLLIATLVLGGVSWKGYGSMKKPMDYKFANNELRYEVTTFDGVNQPSIIENKSLEIIGAPPVDDNQLVTVRRELSNSQLLEKSGEMGSSIEFAILNHENSANNGAIVYNMGVGGDFHHPVGAREAEVLAFANPDKHILIINNTGSGRSSLIPRDMMEQMKRDGIYEPQGKWMLEILEKQLKQYGDKVELWGHSAGARVAMGMAAAFGTAGQNVANLRVVDPPSAVDRTPLGIQMRFVSQIIAMQRYSASPYNETSELDAQTANLFKAEGAFGDNMWNYPLVMRHAEGLATDLYGATGAVRNDLTIIQPEFSEFASPNCMHELIARVAMDANWDSILRPEILRHVVVEGHSHAILSAPAGARPQITLYEIAKND